LVTTGGSSHYTDTSVHFPQATTQKMTLLGSP